MEVGLGERRITNFAGVGISVGEELDISAVMGVHPSLVTRWHEKGTYVSLRVN